MIVQLYKATLYYYPTITEQFWQYFLLLSTKS